MGFVRRASRAALLGGLLGALWVGVLGRLVMFAIASMNKQTHGQLSDDEFVIGQFTFNGSLNFLVFGTSIGVFGGLIYFALRNLRIGPTWFRLLSITLGPAVVTLALLVHPEGRDFTILVPALVSIGLFFVVIWGYTLSIVLAGDRWVPTSTGSFSVAWAAWLARAGLFAIFALSAANLALDVSVLV